MRNFEKEVRKNLIERGIKVPKSPRHTFSFALAKEFLQKIVAMSLLKLYGHLSGSHC
jgi:hypothetical protein